MKTVTHIEYDTVTRRSMKDILYYAGTLKMYNYVCFAQGIRVRGICIT